MTMCEDPKHRRIAQTHPMRVAESDGDDRSGLSRDKEDPFEEAFAPLVSEPDVTGFTRLS
jgi:hypothetical protein